MCSQEAQGILVKLYTKKKNEMVSRRLLATKHQQLPKTIDEFLGGQNKLIKNCTFTGVTAE